MMKPIQETGRERGITELTEAFRLFSKRTTHLEIAYQSLQEQFKSLNLKLEESNRQLAEKVVEVDAMASYLHGILSNMSQGLLFVKLDGSITTFNLMSESILEVKTEQVLHRSFWEIWDDALFGFSMRETLATKSVPEESFCILGQQKEVEVSTAFILNGEPHSYGLILLLRDVTQMRRLEQQAHRSHRMTELGELAASMAHEIRNPLGGIKGFASLLYRDLADRPDSQALAKYIVDGSETLNRLVTNILHYARPIRLHRTAIDLVNVTREAIQLIEADPLKKKQAEIALNITRPIHAILGDSGMLKGAILNLLVNACDAITGPGQVTVNIEGNEERIVIEVRDTGHGIASENLEKIFSPFFTTKVEGNGLGLSEVHRIVQAHGGTIQVKSQVAVGTSFSLTLPLIH